MRAVARYATYLWQFSPWAGREYLFVDDVYVGEESRGSGVGLQLMERRGRETVFGGCRQQRRSVGRPAGGWTAVCRTSFETCPILLVMND